MVKKSVVFIFAFMLLAVSFLGGVSATTCTTGADCTPNLCLAGTCGLTPLSSDLGEFCHSENYGYGVIAMDWDWDPQCVFENSSNGVVANSNDSRAGVEYQYVLGCNAAGVAPGDPCDFVGDNNGTRGFENQGICVPSLYFDEGYTASSPTDMESLVCKISCSSSTICSQFGIGDCIDNAYIISSGSTPAYCSSVDYGNDVPFLDYSPTGDGEKLIMPLILCTGSQSNADGCILDSDYDGVDDGAYNYRQVDTVSALYDGGWDTGCGNHGFGYLHDYDTGNWQKYNCSGGVWDPVGSPISSWGIFFPMELSSSECSSVNEQTTKFIVRPVGDGLTSNVCEETPTDFVDVDGDGYVASIDCNDTNPAINPGETDACGLNGIDEDCNGADSGLCDIGDICTKDRECASNLKCIFKNHFYNCSCATGTWNGSDCEVAGGGSGTPEVYWANLAGVEITEEETVTQTQFEAGVSYKMIFNNSGLSSGTFSIKEYDVASGDEDIYDLKASPEGDVLSATFHFNQTAVDNSGSGDQNAGTYEFYFIINGNESEKLKINYDKSAICGNGQEEGVENCFNCPGDMEEDCDIIIKKMCFGVNVCGNYDDSLLCSNDDCNVAADGTQCAWVGSECGTQTVITYNGANIGTCTYFENTADDNCDDNFLTYKWTSDWQWSSPDYDDKNACETANNVGTCVQYPLDSRWYYDPQGASIECADGSATIACPAQIQLNFFSAKNLIAAILLIAVIYLIIKNFKKQPVKKKPAKKKAVKKKVPKKKK